jgi:hypothetical protein
MVYDLPVRFAVISLLAVWVLVCGRDARAEPPTALSPQIQADVGLAVIGVGYEHPVASHLAVMGEAQIFGTYFLPWFDAGDEVRGLGAQIRATFFLRANGRGLYVMGFGRADAVRGDVDGMSHDGKAFSTGAAAGWVFGLSDRFDLRVGAGAQYIWIDGGALDTSTPFVTLDAVVGFRL